MQEKVYICVFDTIITQNQRPIILFYFNANFLIQYVFLIEKFVVNVHRKTTLTAAIT